jgi:hypothetical protein
MKHLRTFVLLSLLVSPTVAFADHKAEAQAHIEKATAFGTGCGSGRGAGP